MRDEETTTTPGQPSLRNIRYFLVAVYIEVALVVGVFFLLPTFLSLFVPGCDECGVVERLVWCADRGLKIGVTFIGLSLIYMWFIIIPLAAAPLALGLAIDHHRLGREEEER